MLEHWWTGCGWRKTKRLRNASRIVIRTTFPVLGIVDYQGHALRNVQLRQRRAKPNATGSSNSAISWIVRAVQSDFPLLIWAEPVVVIGGRFQREAAATTPAFSSAPCRR
jgi:hypothetical protein